MNTRLGQLLTFEHVVETSLQRVVVVDDEVHSFEQRILCAEDHLPFVRTSKRSEGVTGGR